MQKGFDREKNKKEIDLLTKRYLRGKMKLKEQRDHVRNYDPRSLQYDYKVVSRMEARINFLEDNERQIIINEVLLGKSGDWYIGLFSPSTYYRYRDRAYAHYLGCLDSL